MQEVFSNDYLHGYFDVDIKQPQQLHIDLGLFVFHNLYFTSINLQALNSISSRTRSMDSMDFSLYFGFLRSSVYILLYFLLIFTFLWISVNFLGEH